MQGTQSHQEWNHASRAGRRCLLNGFRRLTLPALVFISVTLLAPLPSHPADSGRKVGGGGYVIDYVDRIEINHVLDADGNVTLDQVIFWDYSPSLAAFVVIDWRTLKTLEQVPYKRGLLYVAQWRDTRDNCGRKVIAGEVVETWTTYDAETTNQEICDRNERRGLTRPPPQRKAVK